MAVRGVSGAGTVRLYAAAAQLQDPASTIPLGSLLDLPATVATHLEHVHSAAALNLIRLNAWWNGKPLDRRHTSHLARRELSLAA